jgi:hypothetical protein
LPFSRVSIDRVKLASPIDVFRLLYFFSPIPLLFSSSPLLTFVLISLRARDDAIRHRLHHVTSSSLKLQGDPGKLRYALIQALSRASVIPPSCHSSG